MVLNNNQNRDITNNIVNDFGLNIIHDIVPSQVNPTIQPVREVYEKVCNVVIAKTDTSTGATIYTTPADKDFYIIGGTLSHSGNNLDDLQYCFIRVVINGVNQGLAYLTHYTGDTTGKAIPFTCPVPVKVDRNTAIALATTGVSAGARFMSATIYGYIKNNKDNTGS